jgi:hypothetical protein
VTVQHDGQGFRRSSFCGSGACVEVDRNRGGMVAVRDSKNPGQPALVFTPEEWVEFIRGAKAGEFDLAIGMTTAADTVRLRI